MPKRIPVLLVLRKYRDLLSQENPPSLPELITQHHIPNLPKEGYEHPMRKNWAADLLRNGKGIVMLDGFDEVARDQRLAVARWINEQMRRYGNSIFIVTSRPKAYKEQDVADRLEMSTALWVRDFSETQRRDFVTRWYQYQEKYAHGGRETPDVKQLAVNSATDLLSQIEARQELKDLAKNPLLLNMIVTFHRRYPGARIPKRRVELYREICQLQLRDRPRARKLDTLLTQCEAQTILQMQALWMMEHRQKRFPYPQILATLKHFSQLQGEAIDVQEFLVQVVQVSELLVEQEDEIEFAHLSFQEYLAAAEIARTQREDLLYDRFDDDSWKPKILLYAGLVNPTLLIRKMLELGATDFAYVCWQDTNKRIDPAVAFDIVHSLDIQVGKELTEKIDFLKASELKSLSPKQARRLLGIQIALNLYERLENYLKNGQWQEADQETYHLMITTVGKEEGQGFSIDAERKKDKALALMSY